MGGDERTTEYGVALLALSLAVLFVAWPQPLVGAPALFGYGTVFLATPLSFVALLLAIVGGVLLVRRFARARDTPGERLAVSVAGPVVPAAVEGAYLVAVIGFGPRATIIVGAMVVAAVVGVVAGLWDRGGVRIDAGVGP